MKTTVRPFDRNLFSSEEYVLVSRAVLPEVFERVLTAKELLENGKARSISDAVRRAELSRSAFYKYKDCVYSARQLRPLVTLCAEMANEPGALQSMLAQLAQVGVNVVTIHQQKPENGVARTTLTVDTTAMQEDLDSLMQQLRSNTNVREIQVVDV